MKIRYGFVSNSSSSSFLVKLPKCEDITFEKIHRLMFGRDDDFEVSYYGDPVSSFSLAQIVTSDLLLATPNNESEIVPNLSSGAAAPCTDDFEYPVSPISNEKPIYAWNNPEYNKARKVFDGLIFNEYLKENPDVNTYVLTYSDDNTTGSILEHAGFLNSFSEKFSNH